MEKKRLITVAAVGEKPTQLPTKDYFWMQVTSETGALIFGLRQRREDDIERALRWTCGELHSPRKMIVREVTVSVKDGRPQLDWGAEFGRTFQGLSKGEVWVEPEIAKVYDRLFLFERVEDKSGDLFLLRGERGRPSRMRGIKPAHAPLVGRGNEMVCLEEILEQVEADQGQIVAFIGEAGIGKTRLTVALKERLEEISVPYVEGTHTTGKPERYQGFREIFTGLTRQRLICSNM